MHVFQTNLSSLNPQCVYMRRIVSTVIEFLKVPSQLHLHWCGLSKSWAPKTMLGDRSLRMGREKNSADKQKPDDEYPATESRMVQTRWRPDDEYPASKSRMVQTRWEPDEEYPTTESQMVQTRWEPDAEYPATESRMVQTRREVLTGWRDIFINMFLRVHHGYICK